MRRFVLTSRRSIHVAATMLVAGLPLVARAQGGGAPQPGGPPTLATAAHHAMQYYVSLPKAWSAQRTWPILVTVTGGLKNFQENAELFAANRGERPFIVVTPVNLTNGGQATLRQAKEYHYPSTVWDEVDRSGWCTFDDTGLDAVVDEVRRLYHGEEKYYIDGHSAGGHLVWLAVIPRPAALAAAITTGGNFARRCLEDAVVAKAPHGTNLPIRGFVGERDEHRAGLTDQFTNARRFAASRGFTNISFAIAKGEDHHPMPAVVYAYLDSLRRGQ